MHKRRGERCRIHPRSCACIALHQFGQALTAKKCGVKARDIAITISGVGRRSEAFGGDCIVYSERSPEHRKDHNGWSVFVAGYFSSIVLKIF